MKKVLVTLLFACIVIIFPAVLQASGTIAITVTSAAGASGSVTRSPSGVFLSTSGSTSTYSWNNNTGVTLTASPGGGSQLDSINCGSGGTAGSNTCSYYVKNNDSYTMSASFKLLPVTYTVTATVSGSGGAITPASQTIGSGGTVTVTATPEVGYALQSISINGGSNQLAQPTFSAVTQSVGPITGNTTVTASFVRYYLVTVTQPANCTILYNGVQPTGGVVKVISGESATFTVTPLTGAVIDQVSYDGTSVGSVSSYTIPAVSEDHTLTATCSVPTSDILKYTIIPPFVNANIQPNLLLMIDNSASMYDMVYDSTGKCYDTSYSTAASYAGYFDEAAVYSYNSVSQRFEPGATMPGSCTFKADDYCVTMTGAKPSRTVSNFVAKGKFLNWLATSKLDLQKKILTGGKYDTASGTLLSESRGCMGRRFIRIVSDALRADSGSAEALTGMTFAVRGPTSMEPDYINPATQGGSTRIEIYDAAYNLASCDAAIVDWSNVTEESLGQVQQSSTDCLGCSGSSCNSSSILKSETYVHLVHQCYWYYNNHHFANTQTLIKDCENVYDQLWPGDGAAPTKITNELSGEAVCSSVIAHPYYTGLPVSDYVANDLGFLGRCVTLTPVTPGQFSYVWNATCLNREMADFCEGMRSSDVTDPSVSGTVTTGISSSVPSFIMDAGVNALGSIAGTFYANLKQSTAPSGLVQEFKDYIRFGVMEFNQDGSASECDVSGTNITCAKHCSATTTKACFINADCPNGESCELNTKLDGGKVVSYISYDSVSDHASGLINSIDSIRASAWTPWAEAYYNAIGYFGNRTDLRLQTDDFDSTKNPSDVSCRLNNILIISDGGSTADQNSSVNGLALLYNDGDTNTGSCSTYAGSKNLDDLAWLAKNRNINNFVMTGGSTAAPQKNNEYITSYVVYSGSPSTSTDECHPKRLMDQTAVNGGTAVNCADGTKACAYSAVSYQMLLDSLRDAFTKIASAASSGTAASIVNKRNESGANLLTAIFYPLREFGTNKRIKWIGDLQNFWYYFDPYFSASGLREDTVQDNLLKLVDDNYVSMTFDTVSNKTIAYRYKFDGSSYTLLDSMDADSLKALWKAGELLFTRSTARTIYSNLSAPDESAGTYAASFTPFTTGNASLFREYLQATSDTEASKYISYTHGTDDASLRNRTVTFNGVTSTWKMGDIISSTPKVQSNIPINSYNLAYGDVTYQAFLKSSDYVSRGMVYVGSNDGMLHAIKLGKVTTPSSGLIKAKIENSGTTSSAIGSEEWAFIPRNVLPYLKYYADKDYNHLYLVDNTPLLLDASINKPTACSEADYWNCDKKTEVGSITGSLDLVKTSWRTLVIGGMGLGGANRSNGSTCNTQTVLSGTETYGDCITNPFPSTKTGFSHVGYSSYFALDVTSPEAPALKWEFATTGLGQTTVEPVIIRINGKNSSGNPDPNKNGRWFALFASGPTGPVNTRTQQFYGRSDKPLKLFVVDIESGKLVTTFDTSSTTDPRVADVPAVMKPSTTYPQGLPGWAGSMATNGVDTDDWNRQSPGFYSTDVVYIGYVRPKTATNILGVTSTNWDNGSDGGVLRLVTNESLDPGDWKLSTLIDGAGPITASIEKMNDDVDRVFRKPVMWLYFGSGRYLYRDTDFDSADQRQSIYGIREPCFATDNKAKDINPGCTTAVTKADLQETTIVKAAADYDANKISSSTKGWYVSLNASDSTYKAERVITTPSARTSGLVIFTTYLPSADVCSFGGNTALRLVDYRTGGLPSCSNLCGKLTIQLSSGAIVSTDLATLYNCPMDSCPSSSLPSPTFPNVSGDGNAAVPSAMPGIGDAQQPLMIGIGKPPAPKPQDDKPRRPVKKILHVMEK